MGAEYWGSWSFPGGLFIRFLMEGITHCTISHLCMLVLKIPSLRQELNKCLLLCNETHTGTAAGRLRTELPLILFEFVLKYI